MNRRKILTGLTLMGLAACNGNTSARIGADGLPLPQIYRIGPNDIGSIQYRMLDSVNTLRQAAGVPAEIEVYEGTLHGWCPPDSQVYNKIQAEKAWSRLTALFKTALA